MTRPSRGGRLRPLDVDYVAGDEVGDEIDWDDSTYTGGGGTTITVEESDASPSVANVDTVIFEAASFAVTDNTDGSVTIASISIAYSPVSVTDDGDHFYLLVDGEGTPVLVEV
jgi:hypothetical protein